MEDVSLQGGQVVCSRWRLRGRLGEGGSGHVWEAETLDSHSRVAIKFLARPPVSDSGARRRFDREVRSISKVRSPHVVHVIDHGQTESGLPFIVTEYLPGQDLGRVLAQERQLGLIETNKILDQLCRALSKLHAVGLVHHDIKPQNVFLLPERDHRHFVKLLDFGLGRSNAGERTEVRPDGTVTGVGPFVSPEQLMSNARVESRSDIWALGVLAYRMLSGTWPFDSSNWVTFAQRVRSATFIPISALRKDLPVELDGWFAQALHPDLARRYQTAEEARAAFERIAHVYTAGMLAKPSPKVELPPQPPADARLIVHPPPSRPDPSSVWRIAACIAVLIILACFALRDPLGYWLHVSFDAIARQFAPPARPASSGACFAPAVSAPPPPPFPVFRVALHEPSQRTLTVPEPEPAPAAPRRRPRAPIASDPPSVPPKPPSAPVMLHAPSPDLPPPSHVYRGF